MWKDSETKIDYLDFDYLKKTVIELVKREDLTPSSIGIYGNWGSGKSSLMKMCIDELSLMPDTLCIYFNGWLFESFEDTKTAIISKILDEIEANRSFKGKTKATLRRLYNNVDKMKVAQKSIQYGLDFMLTGGLGSLVDITFQSVLGSMKNKLDDAELKELSKLYKNNNKSKDIRKSIVSFQTDFATLLEDTKIKKLVVFIDELDRCNPDSILNTLEAIRLFLFVQNTSFVIGADENHIMNAVKMKFNQIKENQLAIGKEYLEKLVQYPIRIPQLSPKEINLYILCLLLSRDLEEHDFKLFLAFIDTERNKDCVNFEITTALIDQNLKDINVTVKNALSFSKQLSSVLANGLNGNPRHCKRFLNSLFMRIFMAKYRNISLEQRVLAKIMLLEYFRPSMFRKLAEIQAEERGKPEELKMIEKGEIDKLKQMSDWNQDKWIKDWVALEPRLTDIDLRPYYYFSRESISSQLNLRILKLSDAANKILEELLSLTTSARTKAISKSGDVNEAEAQAILSKLYDEIVVSTDIDIDVMKSFLEWGSTRESLYLETLNYLKEIPYEKITIGMLPRIKAFIEETKQLVIFKSTVEDWAEKRSDLKEAINQQFKKE